jgi:MFS family permease
LRVDDIKGRAWPGPLQAWGTVAILNLAYLVSFVDRTILSLLVEPIKADLDFSDIQIALLQGTAFGLFYIVLGIPFGWAVDRYSRKRIIGIACALWCLMTAACGLASGFVQLFVARLGVGLGEAALSPGATSMIADLFPPQRRALAVSVYAMGGSLGVGLSLLAGGWVIGLVNAEASAGLPLVGHLAAWRVVLILVGAMGLLVAGAILLLPEPARREVAPTLSIDWTGLQMFWRHAGAQLVPQFTGIALLGLVAYAVLGWVPAFFTRVHGWTAAEVGLRYGLVFLIFGGGGALTGGWLSGRFIKRGIRGANLLTAVLAATILMPFAIAAPLVADGWLALSLFAPVAFGFAAPTGSSIAALQDITPGPLRGQIAAIYYLILGVVGLLLGPLIVAVLTDTVFADPLKLGWSIAVVCAVVQPVAALALWRARRAAITLEGVALPLLSF